MSPHLAKELRLRTMAKGGRDFKPRGRDKGRSRDSPVLRIWLRFQFIERAKFFLLLNFGKRMDLHQDGPTVDGPQIRPLILVSPARHGKEALSRLYKDCCDSYSLWDQGLLGEWEESDTPSP